MTSLTDSLKECGAIKSGDFTLSSGKKSKYYIDIKKASASPRILKQVAHEISVRKEAKEYGTKGQIVGDFIKNSTVLMVEDVATTGGSVLKAIKLLKGEGLIIRHVIVVVDREEGATDALADEGVELIPLVRIGELLHGN